jgi:hypothetical protein
LRSTPRAVPLDGATRFHIERCLKRRQALLAEIERFDGALAAIFDQRFHALAKAGRLDQPWVALCTAGRSLLDVRCREQRGRPDAEAARWRAWRVEHVYADLGTREIARFEGITDRQVRNLRKWSSLKAELLRPADGTTS